MFLSMFLLLILRLEKCVSHTVKKLYGMKTGKEDRWPRYLLYFDFIPGFNNYSMGEEIIPESKWNGCISQTRC